MNINMISKEIINEEKIFKALNESSKKDSHYIKEVLEKAKEAKGLSLEEAASLFFIKEKELETLLFDTAIEVKQKIYGPRLVFFVPLYLTNKCVNDCLYCGFRASNKSFVRKTLSKEEAKKETQAIISTGHKRILLVAGEDTHKNFLDYVNESIRTIYETRIKNNEIRRININIAPLEVEGFKEVKASKIGTYQCFQETYHRETYEKVHLKGKKSDYDWRLTVMDRAYEGGIDDVGIGVLYGLYDYKFDTLALLSHAFYLDSKYGVGPHTISVPRIEPATGAPFSESPPYALSDEEFKKVVAILRLAVPYTGIILSTRESPLLRNELFHLGVSQISAGSKTSPGGYSNKEELTQFELHDARGLDEVVKEVLKQGFLPSFCTACYRTGRVGNEFMKIAKSGAVKDLCSINALSTFVEYLLDYASDETKEIGFKFVENEASKLKERDKKIFDSLVKKVMEGKRDIYI